MRYAKVSTFCLGNAATMKAVERTARDAIPNIADFCLVHVVDGTSIPCVAAHHISREKQTRLRALMRSLRIRRNDLVSSVAQVIRTKRPLLRTRVYEDPSAALRRTGKTRPGRGQVTELHRRLAPCSVLVVPIMAGSAVLGALSLCYSESRRSYATRHLGPAKRLALKIANALKPRDRISGQSKDYLSTRQKLTAHRIHAVQKLQ